MSTLSGLWRQWLPTALGSSMLVLEIPVVAAAVARSTAQEHAVAALGIGIAVIVVLNSPALALAPLVVSLHGRVDPRRLRAYALLVGVLGAVGVAAAGSWPAGLRALLDLDTATTGQVGGVLLALAPASVAVAARRYLHGRLITEGVTGGIAVATGVRLAGSAALAWSTVPLVGSPATAGALALTVGAFAETAALAVALRRLGGRATPQPPTDRVPDGLGALALAHAPVAASRLLNMVPQLATTIGIAHAVAALPSLTAWPVLYGLLSLFTGPLSDLETVSAAALRRDRADRNPARLAAVLAGGITAGYALVLLTPLARGYLGDLSGLTGEPLRLAVGWGVLTVLVPAGWVLRGHLRGTALADGRQAPLAYGAAVHLAGLAVALAVTVPLGLPGLAGAALAVTAGVLAEILALAWPGRSSRRPPSGTTPPRPARPPAEASPAAGRPGRAGSAPA